MRARARTQCARRACGGAGHPSPAFARGSARRGGSERPACEASPAALGATHSVECVPAAARGVPPPVASPMGADSRGRGASGRGAGRPPPPRCPGAPPGVAHSAVHMRLAAGRRPLVAGWHVRCGGGPDVWARAARARSSSAAGGALPRAALRGGVRAPERHERALEGGLHSGCVRGTLRGRGPPSFGALSQGCALRRGAGENPQWRAQPAGARKKNDASIHRDEQCCSVRLSDSTCSGTVKHGDRYLSCARPWSGAAA